MFEKLLNSLVKNRNKPDLHSAMCYFESGLVVFISANWNKSIDVQYCDEHRWSSLDNVGEVLELFKDEVLLRYEI